MFFSKVIHLHGIIELEQDGCTVQVIITIINDITIMMTMIRRWQCRKQ